MECCLAWPIKAKFGKGEESYYKWSRSHDHDGHHAHIHLNKVISERFSYSFFYINADDIEMIFS